MASKALLPRRGRRSTMLEKNPVLRKGEVFFEVPEDGVGKGMTRIIIGDGLTPYADLPYAVDPESAKTDLDEATVAFTESVEDDRTKLLGEISTGRKIPNLFGSIRKFLTVINTAVTNLNNDKADKIHTSKKGSDIGVATDESYGHVKISNALGGEDSDDTAASVSMVNTLFEMIITGVITVNILLEDKKVLLTEDGQNLLMEVSFDGGY